MSRSRLPSSGEPSAHLALRRAQPCPCGGLRRKQKKPAWWNTPRAFHHAGLLVNEPPTTGGLPFIQSSDDINFDFCGVCLRASTGTSQLPILYRAAHK